nr:GDSL-type esterase/lipase family protein [uncultured Aminipila sp.]
MVKIKNQRRFRIFIIISIIGLVVLIWCMIWINIANGDNNTNPGGLSVDENVASTGEKIENLKDNQGDKGKAEEKSENEKAGTKEENKVVESTDNSNDSRDETNTAKPIVVPEKLPEDEVYAVYNNTLIIGDSRTEGFKLYSGVKNASYFCMKAMTIDKIVEGKQVTIDGQSVSVYDMLGAKTYDKVIIGVGLNELGWNHIETFLEDYGQLIDKIKEKQPNATIYLQAVLPVSKSKSDSDKVHNNPQIYWYNENIIKLASDKGAQFVNPAAALVDADGYLVTEATTDGVHLNSDYCKVWAKYLAELV